MACNNYVTDILKEIPPRGRTIVLIRHANRDSFRGIPDSLREGVTINAEGIRAARAFGESLGYLFPGKDLLIGHTVATRCRMTAEYIGEGYRPTGRVRILGCNPEVESVVVDPEQYVRLREEYTWPGLMKRWLDLEVPETTLQNPFAYSRKLLFDLASFPGMDDDDLMVVIAHDVTIFPLLLSVFGKPVVSLDFLNGIVIRPDSGAIKIRYRDAGFSAGTDWAPG